MFSQILLVLEFENGGWVGGVRTKISYSETNVGELNPMRAFVSHIVVSLASVQLPISHLLTNGTLGPRNQIPEAQST